MLPLLLAGCTRPHPIPTQPGALPPPPLPVAAPTKETAPPELVEQAQRGLAELGYEPGPVDGIIGQRTEAAVRNFQESLSLEPDGRLSEALISELDQALQVQRTAQVQRRLAALGYEPGEADGQNGPRTHRAIEAFETWAGLPPKGRVTPELLERIAEAEARKVQWVAEEVVPRKAPNRSETGVMAAEAAEAEAGAGQPDVSELERVAPAAGSPAAESAGGTAGEAAGDTEIAAVPAVPSVPAPSSETASGAVERVVDSKRVILPGDVVRLRVGRDRIETLDFTVGLDGSLFLPDGVSVQAAGLTFKELEDLVMVKLVEIYLMGLEVDVLPQAKDAETAGADSESGGPADGDPEDRDRQDADPLAGDTPVTN